MTDYIGSSNMAQGSSTYFTSDRSGNSNAALALNGGYTYVPSGVFFNTPFTIAVWVYPVSLGAFARILDFGSGAGSGGGVENVVFVQTWATTNEPYFYMNGVNYLTSTSLTMSSWQHLAATYDGTTLKMYRNGVSIMSTSVTYSLPSITRTYCYIGKSNWADGYSYSYIDELRIYNTALSSSSISALYSQGIFKKYIVNTIIQIKLPIML